MSAEAWAESGEAWTRWVRGPSADRYEPFTDALQCALPFAPGTFDLTVARISLQDVDDLDRAVAEAARVLASGGSLCAAVFHPVCAGGRIDGEQFVVDCYFDEGPWVTTHDADGLPLTIHSHRGALDTSLRATGDAGLAVQTVTETASPGPLSAVPLVLAIRAGKP
jgi:SAM-dependent methyltransferase